MDNTNGNEKKVAVLLPTLNEELTLNSLLESLNKNTYKNKEIIVIDGNSIDKTVEIAKKAGATVLIETGSKQDRCPANARNQGAAYTNADILCFLDADCTEVNPTFLENVMVKMENNNIATVYTGFKSIQNTITEKILGKKNGIAIYPTFIPKAVFNSVNGYPLIGYGEDRIFDANVKKYAQENGMATVEVQESYFLGRPASSLRELFVQHRWYGKTLPIYSKTLGKKKPTDIIKIYFKPLYFMSFIFALFSFANPIFIILALPFIFLFLTMFIKNSGWGRLKSVLNLFSGISMIIGIIMYMVKSNAGKGR